MPIRPVMPRSERGSLKDVLNGESYEPPTAEELKLKQLYEHSEATNDEKLQEALGFIVMPYSNDRSSYPVSLYRHREYINSLSKKMADKIEQTKQQLANCFSPGPSFHKEARKSFFKQASKTQIILSEDGLIVKLASAVNIPIKPKRSFRRAR